MNHLLRVKVATSSQIPPCTMVGVLHTRYGDNSQPLFDCKLKNKIKDMDGEILSNTLSVLVVKDNEDILRPQAGIWTNNQAGKISAEIYQEKNNDITIVECDLIEK